ncbi:AAA domain-containing protein [Oceanisphaera sp. W20_SRM_FM3]|uniref:AAA domain-containing protein n=1 Tax=Oceanisphaera sp. W20_SRM_FM3 TaxID=3240267 RepID=UPI003F998B1E
MDNPFFTALEDNGFDAATLAKQTNDVLVPFINYLNNSIKALEDKEVSCEWKPVATHSYRLKPNLRIWRLTPVCEIEIADAQKGWHEILSGCEEATFYDGFDPQLEDPLIVGKGASRQRFIIKENDYRAGTNQFQIFLPEIAEPSEIQWSGYSLLIRPLSVDLGSLAYVHVDGQQCKVVEQTTCSMTLEGQITESSSLSIEGQSVAFKVIKTLNLSALNNLSVKPDGNAWRVLSENRPSLASSVTEDITKISLSQLNLGDLQYKEATLAADDWTLSKDSEGLLLEACSDVKLQIQEQIRCTLFSGISFAIERRKVAEKWIQLIEKDNVGDDTGKSELDYFFDENQGIKILDSTENRYGDGFRVLKSRPEDRQVLLAKNLKGKRNRDSEYPAIQGSQNEIRVSVDTSQLKKQKDAINQLVNRPAVGHRPLIHLLQARDKIQWQDVSAVPEQSIQWKVLTDPSFDGSDRQREFVSKALASQDFTILDGPPGTGKTTTILELIIQLVLDGKRVLLSASTHAAINNVLERIKDDSALNKHVFPLRIGNENNATGVEDFQFENVFDALRSASGCEDISKQLMIDASNLVCGTTIGILRLFNEKDIALDKGEPPFDVMIIDECSKTTFQEFLVPARFAKRWVLVGDVRQLSPFTDREQIVTNLDQLMLRHDRDPKKIQYLSPAIQQACFLLEELRGNSRKDDTPYQQPMVVPVTAAVLQALSKELEARFDKPNLRKGLSHILLIAKSGLRVSIYDWFLDSIAIQQQPLHLYNANLCFIDEAALPELQYLIPNDMLVLHKDWPRTSQAFVHKHSSTKTKAYKIKNTEKTDTQSIQQELLDRLDSSKWSEEVCWRLEREYWLRLSKNHHRKTNYLSETLERLLPKSVQADGRIHILKNIAFPSILEALSGSGLEKLKRDAPTTLNQGFNRYEKPQRHTTLTYQHRMHPDISAFPRSQFYPKGVLADGSQTTPARQWAYKRYKARNTWLNINGKTSGNSNAEEVQALITELKAFCDWAEGNMKNQKDEPYDVAVLTFYKRQEKALREALQKLPSNAGRNARFSYKGVSIKLATVDYFQGQEADVVFLSMVNTQRDGFMDSPNRLNVSITRARYQLIVVGHYRYFSEQSRTEELRNLARSCEEYLGCNAKKSAKNGMN